MSSAGNWTIEVSEPHPMWCRIVYRGGPDQEVHSIHHKELHDLRYALDRAIKEARDKLPEGYKHEMD